MWEVRNVAVRPSPRGVLGVCCPVSLTNVTFSGVEGPGFVPYSASAEGCKCY